MHHAVSMRVRVWSVAVIACGALAACSAAPTHDDSPLPTPTETSATAGAQPSFDCAKAVEGVPKLICDDPQLAELDVRLAREYQRALSGPSAKDLRSTEDSWLTGRDDCWTNADVRRCVVEAYQTRLVELHIDDPATVAPQVVTYRCPTLDKLFTAQFYNDFDPNAAVLSLGDDTAITFVEPSGSGARYGRGGVEFAEHQGEVTVNFNGIQFVCGTP